jgi:hypothetical protein
MTKSVIKSIRCSEDEWAAWEKAAGPASFNSWARAQLNMAVSLGAPQRVPRVEISEAAPAIRYDLPARRRGGPDPKVHKK